MIFQHTWQAVLEGRKCVTRRLYRGPTRYKEGGTYAIQAKWGGRSTGKIRLISARKSILGFPKPLTVKNHGVTTPQEAQKEGFLSIEDFEKVWFGMHSTKGIKADRPIIRFEFELIEVTDFGKQKLGI